MSHYQQRGPMTKSQCTPEDGNDFVTIAQAADGKLMTKIFFVDSEGREQIRNFDKEHLFNFYTRPVTYLEDLALILDGLDQYSCVIHGKLIEGTKTPCRGRLIPDAATGDPATMEGAAHF